MRKSVVKVKATEGFKSKVNAKYTLAPSIREEEFKEDLQTAGYLLKGSLITAMSFPKKEALSTLKGLHGRVIEHLLLVTVLPQDRDAKHWKTELRGWQKELRRYNKGKLKRGDNYSEKILMQWLWDYPFGEVSDRTFELKELQKEKYTVPDSLSKTQTAALKKSVEEYIQGVLVP